MANVQLRINLRVAVSPRPLPLLPFVQDRLQFPNG